LGKTSDSTQSSGSRDYQFNEEPAMKINRADLLNPQFNTAQLQQLSWQAPGKYLIASSWGDDLDVWKIGAISGSVPCDERPLFNFCMSAKCRNPAVAKFSRRRLDGISKKPAPRASRHRKAKAAAERSPDQATGPDRRQLRKPVPVPRR
jgi:hypothetical protein